MGMRCVTPALLTRMSTGPISCTAAWTELSSATSMNMARPAAPIAAALRVAPSMSMSPSTTSAPAVARAEAIAFPRPVAEPAPVTNATLPTSVTFDILCVVSQSEVFDDLLRDLRGRRPDVHADCRLIRGGLVEIGKLAVKQARAHEVAVA